MPTAGVAMSDHASTEVKGQSSPPQVLDSYVPKGPSCLPRTRKFMPKSSLPSGKVSRPAVKDLPPVGLDRVYDYFVGPVGGAGASAGCRWRETNARVAE